MNLVLNYDALKRIQCSREDEFLEIVEDRMIESSGGVVEGIE